jgi:hypothetical protein
MILVVVAKPSLSFVFVGVGSVIVLVTKPEKIVTGGKVDVVVAETCTVSVVVVAGAKKIVVVFTGMSPVIVTTGASGARRSRGAAASRALSARLCLAASMRARAHSMSTARSALRMNRCIFGMVVGVTRAAGWILVGEYLPGLSGRLGRPGVVQEAVVVCVMTANVLVREKNVLVMIFVEVVVVGGGVSVFVFFAVPLASVTVDRGPVVINSVKVVVVVCVSIGVEVMLKVTTGVKVVVTGVPTVR